LNSHFIPTILVLEGVKIIVSRKKSPELQWIIPGWTKNKNTRAPIEFLVPEIL
jgi:hypothetical protein